MSHPIAPEREVERRAPKAPPPPNPARIFQTFNAFRQSAALKAVEISLPPGPSYNPLRRRRVRGRALPEEPSLLTAPGKMLV